MTTFLSSIIAITIGLARSEKSHLLPGLQAKIISVFSIVSVIFLIGSPLIMESIKTPAIYALPIVLMILTSIPITVISGYLNSKGSLISLGVTSLIIASVQFLFGLTAALLFHSGLLVISAMVAAQICSLLLIRYIFRHKNIPKIRTTRQEASHNAEIRKILIYTILASFAIMSINILQVFDLFIIQHIPSADIRMYTDIYVISRAVYFFGLIIIWPFLGAIDIHQPRNNLLPILKLVGIFTALFIGSSIAMHVLGHHITELLFGRSYIHDNIALISSLSILFKVFYLITTALLLYFIVIRHIFAIIIAVIAIILTAMVTLLQGNSSLVPSLANLVISSGIIALASGLLFGLHLSIGQRNKNQL